MATNYDIMNDLLQHHHRFLQPSSTETRGRTILTILYLIVLGLCFVVPIFYYCRVHWEDRVARRQREEEMEAIEASIAMNQEETRAARRKYREEKRARLEQLFQPFTLILEKEHFPHLTGSSSEQQKQPQSPSSIQKNKTSEKQTTSTEEGEDDVELGTKHPLDDTNNNNSTDFMQDPSGEETTFILVPPAGISSPSSIMTSSSLLLQPQPPPTTPSSSSTCLRQVPNLCAICICNYEVEDSVVFSSNSACEHVFHHDCIHHWLMKQRGAPLCPCCRREFVIDPYDDNNIIMDNNNNDDDDDHELMTTTMDEGDNNNTGTVLLAANPMDGDDDEDGSMEGSGGTTSEERLTLAATTTTTGLYGSNAV